jgi:hypothetical protein
MKTALIILFTVLSTTFLRAQTRTINAAGTWSNTAIWTGANVADLITENPSMNNNIGTVTVASDYTVGDVSMNNGNTLTINSGITLNVGQSGTPKSITSGNTGTINITGTLIIWGDLNVGNNLDLNVAVGGILIIKGNVNMGVGGDLVISGSVQIDGNFVGGNDTDLIVNGTVNIGGNLSVGNNSDPSGTGKVTVGGTCLDGNSNFCGNGPLPIKLISFSATRKEHSILIRWATASELNFDYFSIEKSSNGIDFSELEQVKGHGTTNERKDYQLMDNNPLIGKNYYRLKSVDFDGYTEYFNVLLVNFSGEKTVSIFPNPSDGKVITFAFNFVPEKNTTITIFDNYSSSIEVVSAVDPWQSVTFNTSLKSGLYFARIVTKDFVRVERFVVR